MRGEGEEEKNKRKNQGKKKKLREVKRKPAMLGLGEIKEKMWVW
jgi:hypothetical protein